MGSCVDSFPTVFDIDERFGVDKYDDNLSHIDDKSSCILDSNSSCFSRHSKKQKKKYNKKKRKIS